ncbi:Ig-like domain-containing protein [Capnocytophaga leadbetteri]|uniref:Ig-like domain-containing protein n=1 Tax=Capnocytophaga leadbetteri TaxID=327575 RepID=UPI0028EE42FA|nr:Ig-like domain-containing protein [Capnocytophaga leadbetteri]
MNVNIKKLLLTTFMVLSAVWFSSAQTNYSITKKVPEGANPQISIEELAVNHLPYNGKDKIYTRVLAKNGIQFTITFPNSYNNLTIERMNTNIVVEGRRILVKEAGSLAFKYSYIENGESHDCGVLGHVNYYGELEYEGQPLTSRSIIISSASDLSKRISADPKMAGAWWRVKVGSSYVDIYEGTQTRTLQELLDFAKAKGVNGKAEFEVEFSDGTSNRFYKDGVLMGGAYSVQYFSIEDARTYKVNLSQQGQGTVSVAKNEFTAGEAVALSAQAAQGWQFSHWEENGQSLGTANPLTFTMEAHHRTIKAVFIQIPKYTITLQIVDTKGAILARSLQQRVQSGGSTTFQVPNLPNTNFKGWYRNGQLVGTGNTYSLSNITQDETIQAIFEIPVQTVTLSFTELSLKVGERGELPTATVTPDNASDKTISWASDNEAVAKIEDGSVVGVSSGTTQLIASSANGKTAALQVVVTQQPQQPQVVPVQSVTVTPASITAKVGDAPVQLTATVLPANATTPTVSWLSANEQVVKVDSNGKVTIIAAGETTIKAKAGEKSFTVQVKVAAAPQQPQQPQVIPVQSVTVTPASITAKVGDAPVQLTATVLPANATTPTVSWLSANEQVVKVDSNGKVTIIAAGETTIKAKAGEKSFTVQVKVAAAPQQPQQPQVIPVQSVTVTPASITAKVGDAPVQLTATVLPANATTPTVSWLSANEQVVKVDSNGKVTIIAAGETTIEAKAGEKTFTVQVKVEAQAPLTPPAEEFPPYIKDFPTEITQGTAINISQWEHLGSISASQIRYHFTDADGKVLGVAPATLQANSLTFTQSGTFVLVATLPANTAGWTEVRFSITVKIKN